MRKCTACGVELEADEKFCDECGTRIVLLHNGIVCRQCNTEIPAGQLFCGSCGMKVKIIYSPRTCSHCGNVWTPRKADPKYCPGCGYNLSRDNVMEVAYIYDEGTSEQLMAKCTECKKMTRRYAMYREINTPKEFSKVVCYVCIIKSWLPLLQEEIDMIKDSFDTTEKEFLDQSDILELQERLTK